MAGSSIIATTGDMMRSGREVEERRCDYVCVLILVDTTAPKALALPVRDAFSPRLPTCDVHVVRAGSDVDLLAPPVPDVCVAVMGRDAASISAGVCEIAAAGVPVALVVESALDAPNLPLGETTSKRVSILSATNAEVLTDRLAEWLVGAGDKSIAFAANFPFCRSAKVRELTHAYAVENAMRAAKYGKELDIATMAINQARLALAIAAINGQPLALGRIPEVASAIGAGMGSRIIANKGLGRLPLVGWALQAGVDYLGTQATGRTLQRRFDKREQKEQERNDPSYVAPSKSHESMASRTFDKVRKRVKRRSENSVTTTSSYEVRLLPGGDEGGYLVYDSEDAS